MSSSTLERCKWIYNLVQHQALGRLAVLTLLASPNPPHLGPLALEKKSKLSTSANAWVETQGQIQSAMQSAKVWSVGDACELGVHFKATRSRRLRRLGQRNKTFTTHMCRFLLLLACTKLITSILTTKIMVHVPISPATHLKTLATIGIWLNPTCIPYTKANLIQPPLSNRPLNILKPSSTSQLHHHRLHQYSCCMKMGVTSSGSCLCSIVNNMDACMFSCSTSCETHFQRIKSYSIPTSF